MFLIDTFLLIFLPECDHLRTYLDSMEHECFGFWKLRKKVELF
jgi:hypothetical protein